MTAEEQTQPEAGRCKQVSLFLGDRNILVVPGDRVHIDTFPDAPAVMFVDVMKDNGDIERFVNVPFCIHVANPNMVQPVTTRLIT